MTPDMVNNRVDMRCRNSVALVRPRHALESYVSRATTMSGKLATEWCVAEPTSAHHWDRVNNLRARCDQSLDMLCDEVIRNINTQYLLGCDNVLSSQSLSNSIITFDYSAAICPKHL